MPGSQIFGKWNAKRVSFTLWKVRGRKKSDGGTMCRFPWTECQNEQPDAFWPPLGCRLMRTCVKVYFANRLRMPFESTKSYFGARKGTVEGFPGQNVKRRKDGLRAERASQAIGCGGPHSGYKNPDSTVRLILSFVCLRIYINIYILFRDIAGILRM